MLFLLFEVWNDFRTSLFQVGDVSIAVERHSRFPNAEEYSDPAPGYFSDRSMVLHSLVAEHAVPGFAPRAIPSCPVGKLVESLP